jgi:hypothetical protein
MVLGKLLKLCTLLILISANFLSFANELRSISAQEYILQNPTFERKAIIEFLQKQFDNKNQKGVSQEMLNSMWNNKDLRNQFKLARFQIVNQKLYADSYFIGHYYFPVLLKFFENFITKYKVPDVDFIIFLREEIPMNEDLGKLTMGIPSFIMFQDKNSIYEMDKILFPDGFFIKIKNGYIYQKTLDKVNKASNQIAWHEKIEKIFWRGVTTGDFHDYTLENIHKLPRMALVIMSKLYPEYIDANFSEYTPQTPYNTAEHSLRKFCKILFGESPRGVSEAEHIKYKYLISIDGNAATGTRVAWIMNSNSVLLKQESDKIQWYYSALKPYHNYVPVNHSLTDLLDQLNWMKANDDKVQTISSNARSFIQEEMQTENIEIHTLLLLQEYSKLQKDAKIVPTLTASDEVITVTSAINMLWLRFKLYLSERVEQWR